MRTNVSIFLGIAASLFIAGHLFGLGAGHHVVQAQVADEKLVSAAAFEEPAAGLETQDGHGHAQHVEHGGDEPSCGGVQRMRDVTAVSVDRAALGYICGLPPPTSCSSITASLVVPGTPDPVRELGVQRV